MRASYFKQFKRDEAPLFISLPLSFQGEGDTGGEDDNQLLVLALLD